MSEDKLHKGADPELFYFAKQNRKAMTGAEKILWNYKEEGKVLSLRRGFR